MTWSQETFTFGQQIQSHAQELNHNFTEDRQNSYHQTRHHVPSAIHRNTYAGGLPSQSSKHDPIPEDAPSHRSGMSVMSSRAGSGQAQKSQSTGTSSSTIGSRESQLSPTRSERSSQLSRNVSVIGYQSPENLHGILINFETARTIRRKLEIQTITSSSKSFNTKATAVATNMSKHDFFDVAYLVQDTVHLFRANVIQRGISATREFTLPQSRGWCDIALGGDFLAVWGHLPGTGKLVSPNEILGTNADKPS